MPTARVGHQPKLPARAVRPAGEGTRLEAVGPAGPVRSWGWWRWIVPQCGVSADPARQREDGAQ